MTKKSQRQSRENRSYKKIWERTEKWVAEKYGPIVERQSYTIDPAILGTWITDPEDKVFLRRYGRSTFEFRPDFICIFTHYPNNGKEFKMETNYFTEKGVLYNLDPWLPPSMTKYEINNGRLVLKERRPRIFVREH